MATELPLFGAIDFASGEDTYEAAVDIDDRAVRLDLNCRPNEVPPARELDCVRKIAGDISAWRDRCVAEIRKDFDAGGEAAFYVDEFLDILDEDALARALKDADTSLSRREQMLDALHLVRVGFYPDPQLYPNSPSFAVFDFSIGRDILDYLVVVKYGVDFNLLAVDVES